MIYWTIFIALEIYRNYVLIEKRKITPNYGGSFCLRAFFGLLFIFIIYPGFAPVWDNSTIWRAIPVVAFEASSFYILFDPILNKLRKKHWLYRGKKSSWLDPLFIKLGTPFYLTFKAFILIILIITIYALARGDFYRIL